MSDERHEELASLHALGLLDPRERQAFERELASDAHLRRLADELAETAAALALTAPPAAPSAGLKRRVLASIDALAPRSAPGSAARAPTVTAIREAPVRAAAVHAFPVVRWLPWGIAAIFAICCGLLGQAYIAQREALLAREVELAELRDRDVLAQMKIARLASLIEGSPQAVAVAVWDPQSQSGVLNVERLPPIPADRDYQLWVIDPQYPIPVDGGVFHVGEGTESLRFRFTADKPIADIAKFAVSLERKGGVPKAEGPLVLLGP